MSLPHLLLVDDSQAVLAYERAALASSYSLSTAANGVEALEKARALRPDLVLLDLSMPEMDGDQVLAALKSHGDLSDIPVIVISSEYLRAEASLKAGAAAFLPKPIQAAALRALVARTLEEARRNERKGSLAVLPIGVGGLECAIPLASVHYVLHQLPTRPLPFGPPYLREIFDFGDHPVCVLDLAEALQVRHTEPLLNRKLVVFAHEHLFLALCVDTVRDPEEFLSSDVIPRQRLGGTEHGALPRVLSAIVRGPRGTLPVLDATALLSPGTVEALSEALSSAATHPFPPLVPFATEVP